MPRKARPQLGLTRKNRLYLFSTSFTQQGERGIKDLTVRFCSAVRGAHRQLLRSEMKDRMLARMDFVS